MVAGTGVQVYAEDRIAEMIQHKFDVIFIQAWWPQFLTWTQFTLDGTLGVVTADLTDAIKDFADIRVIFPENSERSLTKLNALTFNPFNLTGSYPLFYEALGPTFDNKTSKVFNIWPKTSTGDIVINYRTKPETFVIEDEIDFDDQALILGATFDYLEDDGTNPNATQKFQLLFEARMKQLMDDLSSGPIALDPNDTIPQTIELTVLP